MFSFDLMCVWLFFGLYVSEYRWWEILERKEFSNCYSLRTVPWLALVLTVAFCFAEFMLYVASLGSSSLFPSSSDLSDIVQMLYGG